MILVRFFNVKEGDPEELNLDFVPNEGDEITLDADRIYEVTKVRWQLTSQGLREAGVTLSFISDVN